MLRTDMTINYLRSVVPELRHTHAHTHSLCLFLHICLYDQESIT
jgi:hypothetical protein